MAQKNQNVDTTVQEVDAAISKSEQFIEKNRNNLMYGSIAIIVIVTACWAWNYFSSANNAKAQDEIFAAQFLYEAGDFEQALAGFEDVIAEYGSTKCGNIAKAYAGLCHKELGNYDEAISLLKDFSAADAVVAPAMMCALGDCYVDQETPDYATAAKYFEQAAAAANNAQYSPIYLRKAGLAYEAADNKAAALKAYETIRNTWQETTIGQSIDKYIYRVQ